MRPPRWDILRPTAGPDGPLHKPLWSNLLHGSTYDPFADYLGENLFVVEVAIHCGIDDHDDFRH